MMFAKLLGVLANAGLIAFAALESYVAYALYSEGRGRQTAVAAYLAVLLFEMGVADWIKGRAKRLVMLAATGFAISGSTVLFVAFAAAHEWWYAALYGAGAMLMTYLTVTKLIIGGRHGHRPSGTPQNGDPNAEPYPGWHRAEARAIAGAIAVGVSLFPVRSGDAGYYTPESPGGRLALYGPGLFGQLKRHFGCAFFAETQLQELAFQVLANGLQLVEGGEIECVCVSESVQRPSCTIVVGKAAEPLPSSPVEVGEIRAHRLWLVDKERALLHGTFMSAIWQPGEPMTGQIVDPFCFANGQGVHATKEFGDLDAYAGQLSGDDGDSTKLRPIVVFGTVLLYGTVIEHAKGYRAEYASVESIGAMIAFDLPEEEQRALLAALRRKYTPNRGAITEHG